MKRGKVGTLLVSLIIVAAIGSWLFWEKAIKTQDASAIQLVYEKNCAICHGIQGDGQGPAAYLLQPKPRSFRLGTFRLVSTDNGQPTRQDLFRSITIGMPGTAMPSWAHLPEEQRWGLVDYLLEFSRRGLIEKALAFGDSKEDAESYAQEMLRPGDPIPVPPEPDSTPEHLTLGRQVFLEVCAKCHGEEGEGQRDPTWRTAEGYPTWSRALRLGVFKGGNEAEQLYLRMAAGLPGTPMPGSERTPEEIWHVVHYMQTLYNPEAQPRAMIRPKQLVAGRVSSLPAGADDPRWESVSEEWVPLMPLWWREDVIQGVRVKTVHDGRRLLFRLEWDDSTHDTQMLDQTDFSDGGAVQLTANPTPPIFAMGQASEMVNIWHWKAAWEADPEGGETAALTVPRPSADNYYGREQGWQAAPLDDPLFLPALRLDNPVAWRNRSQPVEDANAAGLGTFTPQQQNEQSVEGTAKWEEGVWTLLMARDLEPNDNRDVPLESGRPVSVAFAVWNGSAGDRNGQKAVSIWNTLTLDE